MSLLRADGDEKGANGRPCRAVRRRRRSKLDRSAVARDEKHAAGVGQDDKSLYVTSIISAMRSWASPLVTSRGPEDGRPADARRAGTAAAICGSPTGTRPRRGCCGSRRAPSSSEEVEVDGLRRARIEAAAGLVGRGPDRAAADEGRPDEPADRAGGAERLRRSKTVSVADLQSVAPQMETVTAVSWAGPSRLVVVGKEAGGVQQVRYIQTDGSTSAAGVLPGLNQVTADRRGARRIEAAGRPTPGTRASCGCPRGGELADDGRATGSSPVYPG